MTAIFKKEHSDMNRNEKNKMQKENKIYDVIIIGAGVTGCATARELSRYCLDICVIEKEEDVCCGTSKANSALVHAGFDAETGSLMARLNVRGNEMMEELSRKLDFPYKRNGALVVCQRKEDMPRLQALYEKGIANQVKGLRIIYTDELREMEPNISEQAYAALYAPTAGIVCPFELNLALAENAYENGAVFFFDTKAENVQKENDIWIVHTNQGELRTKYVVNASGVYADVFHNMVSKTKIHITARRGEYCLLDKTAGGHVTHTIFALPTEMGKGILVTPTIHGNLLLGPTASDIDDKEGTNTTGSGLEEVLTHCAMNVKNIPRGKFITSFAGLRAHEDGHEFIIGEVPDAAGFIDCAGIESPGLSSCPAIGEMVAGIIQEKAHAPENLDFISVRKGFLRPGSMTKEERVQLLGENPAYANIICRCETISEGEIIDAIRRPIGAKSLDGIKRRVRAGMGRCQGGFCSPRVMEILSYELDQNLSDITKSGKDSNIITGKNKENI